MSEDKQLRGTCLADVLEKRRLDQALNAKEFAVLAGVSYSVAREWFHLPGFPVFRGMVFWQDFVQWRIAQSGFKPAPVKAQDKVTAVGLPPRAAQILHEA